MSLTRQYNNKVSMKIGVKDKLVLNVLMRVL